MAQVLSHTLLQVSLWLMIFVVAFAAIFVVSRGGAGRFSLGFIGCALIGCVLYLIILPHI
jgi:hypothetical protein